MTDQFIPFLPENSLIFLISRPSCDISLTIALLYQICYIGYVSKVILLESATDFIDNVNSRMKAKILRTIDLLERYGSFLPLPHSKQLTGYDLYELRVKIASDTVRLFYFHDKGKIFVITSGYVKKTNKTSVREINLALKLKLKYQEDLNEKR